MDIAMLPEGLGSREEAVALRESIAIALDKAERLSRQADFYEWAHWLESDPHAKGLKSISVEIDTVDWDSEETASLIALSYEDGRRYAQVVQMRSVIFVAFEADAPPEKRASPDPLAKEALLSAQKALWFLGEDWGEALEGKSLGASPEAWRQYFFTASDIALWDAAIIGKAAPSPGKGGRGPGRI